MAKTFDLIRYYVSECFCDMDTFIENAGMSTVQRFCEIVDQDTFHNNKQKLVSDFVDSYI